MPAYLHDEFLESLTAIVRIQQEWADESVANGTSTAAMLESLSLIMLFGGIAIAVGDGLLYDQRHQ